MKDKPIIEIDDTTGEITAKYLNGVVLFYNEKTFRWEKKKDGARDIFDGEIFTDKT